MTARAIRRLALIFAMSAAFQIGSEAQSTLNFGTRKRQTENELPKSRAEVVMPQRKAKKTGVHGSLLDRGDNQYELAGGWELASASMVVSRPFLESGFDTSDWYDAVVPGTVLTTLVEQGIAPDPYYGLNNLAISDSLCRTDWWYRIKFDVDRDMLSSNATLLFNGINYRAEIWLNGRRLGNMAGAFKRGSFRVSDILKADDNVLAVRVSPPDNPGIAHEENSVDFGPNGGALCLDGPTFIVSEGWDWIPTIKDRNTGIWQDVRLCFDRGIVFGDTQIVTDLPLPDTTCARITIKMPVRNTSAERKAFELRLESDCFALGRDLVLDAGEEKTLVFTPESDACLNVRNPKLWWPNGYGEQNLHTLKMTATKDGVRLGSASERFGIREMSMELAVDTDETEGLRIEYSPVNVVQKDRFMFDYTRLRDAMVPNRNTFIPMLADGIDPASYTVIEQNGNPYIRIKINGQPIFCRGGDWGIEDAMKRCSREFLEPAFKLHKLENFNMVRNWTGESTTKAFYELCDEYGMLVWNDFWMSTGKYNLLPLDFDLFLDNMTDMVRRFRNHPSIIVWCPRNEGYGEELEEDIHNLLMREDGTRHYHGNSREICMPGSGPWGYHDNPQAYFDYIAYGFNSELGSNSVPPYSTMVKFLPEEDRWPVNDVWYYHDWHVNGWSGWDAFMRDIEKMSSKPCADLKEFCRRSDVLNYAGHRIMFEAYNHKMWNFTSGVLYWISHPAWPSLICQTYSWDWQTFGTFYGCKDACEPVHIQWNIDDNSLALVNTTLKDYKSLKVSFDVYSLDGRRLKAWSGRTDVPANSRVDLERMTLPAFDGIVMARLQLRDAGNNLISQNDYWYDGEKYTNAPKNFFDMAGTGLRLSVKERGGRMYVTVKNTGKVIAPYVRVNIEDAATESPILPAYASDNYFNLLPGASRTVEISCPDAAGKKLSVHAEGVNCEKYLYL